MGGDAMNWVSPPIRCETCFESGFDSRGSAIGSGIADFDCGWQSELSIDILPSLKRIEQSVLVNIGQYWSVLTDIEFAQLTIAKLRSNPWGKGGEPVHRGAIETLAAYWPKATETALGN